MDMSFTNDPEWIRQREALWEDTLEKFDISAELSSKTVEALRRYFMTGEVAADGEPPGARSRLSFFPAMNIEAIEHVLKYNMPDGASDKDIEELKIFFYVGVKNVPGISLDEALTIFRYVFGTTYSPNWELPFIVGNENEKRRSHLDPHGAFQSGAIIVNWLGDPNDPEPIWFHLMDYWFSLLPHVDPIVFRVGDRSHWVPGVNMKVTHRVIKRLLGICAHQIDCTKGAPEGEERRQYMREFYERMETMDGPDDLLALWQSVKDSDPEEFE